MLYRAFSRLSVIRTPRAFVPAVVLLALLGGLAVATPLTGLPIFGAATAPALQEETEPTEPGPETIFVTAITSGLQPSVIEVRPGAKRLVISNRLGLPDLTFTVERPGRDVELSGTAANGGDVSAIVPFAPGEWRITEASNPDWECLIVVTP